MPNEIWVPCAGHELHYEVSNLGRIRRIAGGRGTKPGHILKPVKTIHGYLNVVLCVNNKKTRSSIHRLVLSSFDKPMPKTYDTCHIDGTRTNNNLENLKWGTRSDNMQDAARHGRTNRGERCNFVKLTADQVVSIRSDTRTQAAIAAAYGVHPSTISNIRTGKKWAWLK